VASSRVAAVLQLGAGGQCWPPLHAALGLGLLLPLQVQVAPSHVIAPGPSAFG
jgi:hypothetical protein